MSIQSLGGLYGPAVIPNRPSQQGAPRETVEQGRVNVPASRESGRETEVGRVASSAGELPVEAPPGTDPELWSVLTGEERRFFAQARAMGPVTYGRGNLGLAELALQRGGRLDVRV